MIDPVSIGVAFTAAQSAVNGVKKAISLGKDINSVINDIGKFFRYSQQVYEAAGKSSADNYKKSDAELSEIALQLAMSAKKLREDEKMLKDLLYWSGNAQVWVDMQKEHLRLIKEKREYEKRQRELRIKRNQEIAEAILTAMVALVATGIVSIILTITFRLITKQ